MANNSASKWAVEMAVVEQNFRILFERAQDFSEPVFRENETENNVVYKRRKHQLVTSMLFYTTRVIADGIRVVMTDRAPKIVFEVLKKMHELQEDILQLGAFPSNFQRTYELFDNEDFCSPSPLVLFLKMALASGRHTSDLNGIQTLLDSLRLRSHSTDICDTPGMQSRTPYTRYTPGVPACIMALQDPNLNVIISATRDRYEAKELAGASANLWQSQLQRIKSSCGNVHLGRINKLETLSKDFITVTDKDGVKRGNMVNINHELLKQFLRENADDPTQKRVVLTGKSGILATWSPDGSTKNSCLLDYYRFHTMRPANNRGRSRLVFKADSCAEWFGFIELVYRRGQTEGWRIEERELLRSLV